VVAAQLPLLVLGVSIRILTQGYWSVSLPVGGDLKLQPVKLGRGWSRGIQVGARVGSTV